MVHEGAMEPEFAAFLELVRNHPDFDPFSVPPAEAAARLRAPLLKKPAPPHPTAAIYDEVVEHAGLHVPVRVYAPKEGASRAVVLNLHGGGFVVGSVSMDDHRCTEMATSIGCTVVSVDYRLAPENPFPAAMDVGRPTKPSVI
jgi:acetyl esterase/lipase